MLPLLLLPLSSSPSGSREASAPGFFGTPLPTAADPATLDLPLPPKVELLALAVEHHHHLVVEPNPPLPLRISTICP